MKIAFVGMSHLGINYALAAAEKGFKVICYDQDQKTIKNLSLGNFPFFEPNIDNLYNILLTFIIFFSYSTGKINHEKNLRS